MEPILKTIAREYSQRYQDIRKFCFVFPNKRCGVFFKNYLEEDGIKTEDFPYVYTISDFVSHISQLQEANRIVQLFTLFNSYREIIGEEVPMEFDDFRNWGETVLADFNTVDLYLRDSDLIFKNVKDYREISANFLNEDQKEVMAEYFGVETTGDSNGFWKVFEDYENTSELQKKFLNLWQILGPLHLKFIESLNEKGLGSTGWIYRKAAEKVEKGDFEISSYNKIIFVGFNALTEAERSIFRNLQNIKGFSGFDSYVDFIWDLTGPILNGKNFSASRFVDYNRRHFPEPDWFSSIMEKYEVTNYPEIEIISAPSVTAQSKVAGEILSEYKTEEKKHLISKAEVALVLPDETLLSNTLYSLPEDIGFINLTMGYSLKQTPVSSYVSLLRRLYLNARESKQGLIFFMKDLRMLFSHPYSFILFDGAEVTKLLEYADQYHKVRLYLEEIKQFLPTSYEYLRFPSKNDTEQAEDIFKYLNRLLDSMTERLLSDSNETENEGINQDAAQIKVYLEYLDSLEHNIKEYKIQISPLSILQLTERLLSGEKIGFEGEPLSGLQVMGTLETRSLDFKHVIIMSMNEGVMPRKAMTSTFIPETLRKAYGLPPARYSEEIFSYYFYRLISRAEKVTLIYDGRTVSGQRGGESRYLLQLREYVPSEKLKEQVWQYRLQSPPNPDSSIPKTPQIRELTLPFTITGEGRKNFSASSLNTYRECEVKFFLQNILNINSDPDREEFMDAITIGDVLHNVMMELYLPPHQQKQLLTSPVIIDENFLNKILSKPAVISSLVEKNIQEFYYGNKGEKKQEIKSGVTDIIAEQIEELVKNILQYDLKLAPFNLYGCEVSENIRVKLHSGRIVNFRFAIDRLDEIIYNGEKKLRIVDYKTGSKKRKAENLTEVFKGGYYSEQIFQLFTYAWLLDKIGKKGNEDLITEIYFVPDLIKEEGGLPELEGEKVDSYNKYAEEFDQKLDNMIEGIFENPRFEECTTFESCVLCAFRTYCGK